MNLGCVYSYIRVLPDEFLLKSVVITVDFKRNWSSRTRVFEFPPPPPPINALLTALVTNVIGTQNFRYNFNTNNVIHCLRAMLKKLSVHKCIPVVIAVSTDVGQCIPI